MGYSVEDANLQAALALKACDNTCCMCVILSNIREHERRIHINNNYIIGTAGIGQLFLLLVIALAIALH